MALLAISDELLERHIATSGLTTKLANQPLIGVSAALYESTDNPRFTAMCATLAASWEHGLPHMVMLDDRSHSDAADNFRSLGAIVVQIDNRREGGLARPYVAAAQLIDKVASDAVMLKFEGEKALAGADNLRAFLNASQAYHVMTGVRSDATWRSMPPAQQATERLIGSTIGQLLGISRDTPSGVIGLTWAGRRVFVETTEANDWSYLIKVPKAAMWRGLNVGEVPVDFLYHPDVVEEESVTEVAKFNRKRIEQAGLMVDAAVVFAGGESRLDDDSTGVLRRFNDRIALIQKSLVLS